MPVPTVKFTPLDAPHRTIQNAIVGELFIGYVFYITLQIIYFAKW